MEEIAMTYMAQAVYALLALALGYAVKSVRGSRHDYALLKDGMRSLLKERLIHKCEKCLTGGYCSVDYRNGIEDMYRDYHALGGNGTVTHLLNQVRALPIAPPGGKDG